LRFDPAVELFEKSFIWINTTFEEDVILDIDIAWGVVNVSCTVNYPTSFLDAIGVVFDGAWDVGTSYTITDAAGTVDLFAETSGALGGAVTVATITFNITDQDIDLTTPYTDYTGEKNFTNYVVMDDVDITALYGTDTETATVTVEAYLPALPPFLSVEPPETFMGPHPCIGEEFDIAVNINKLHPSLALIAVEFRLTYCDDMLEVVSVTEGDYLGGWAPHGTWFAAYVEPNFFGPHILVGNMILPNGTGHWNPPFPGAEDGELGENGTIAIIRFRVIKQIHPLWINCTLDFVPGETLMIDASGGEILYDPGIPGIVYITTSSPGRVIDLYGGALNAGYGAIPFPAPYGGQGPNNPMDLVIPQSEVTLCANVTYNWWPVQQKDVGFEVEGPYWHLGEGIYEPKPNWFILLKETARSDEDGVACISFAMPWPCDDPESLLGVYAVTATVMIRDEVVTDTLYFYYDYMVHIWKVTTDKYAYNHCEEVEITVEYGSHAMQCYPGLFAVAIKDSLNVVIGLEIVEVVLGGAEFCMYANGSFTVYLHIPKWAFVCTADIYVSCYDMDPTDGGFAWCPGVVVEDVIAIQPY
jgi:hypothetical protein